MFICLHFVFVSSNFFSVEQASRLLEENLNTFFISGTTDLLLQWCRAVCGKYEFPVQNFTMSFADGRAFCLLVHHYQPSVLPLDEICLELPAAEPIDRLVHPEDRSSGEAGWSCTFSPSRIELRAKETEKKMQNFRVLQQKLEQLGSVPYLST
jgi:abnormal spindle-like microcephaly-associated protein